MLCRLRKAAQGVYDFANMILNLRDQLDGLSITEAVEAVWISLVIWMLFRCNKHLKVKRA